MARHGLGEAIDRRQHEPQLGRGIGELAPQVEVAGPGDVRLLPVGSRVLDSVDSLWIGHELHRAVEDPELGLVEVSLEPVRLDQPLGLTQLLGAVGHGRSSDPVHESE